VAKVASHQRLPRGSTTGYVVITIDHTYEASEVEFPGGRVVTSVLPAELVKAQVNGTVGALLRKVLDVRVADVRFVAGEVAAAVDPHRIGMFGVSAGGFTARPPPTRPSRRGGTSGTAPRAGTST
jgi:hypothetical protein